MNSNSKQKFNDANKRKGMKAGQYACIKQGAGINPAMFVDESAKLIRVTSDGIMLYGK